MKSSNNYKNPVETILKRLSMREAINLKLENTYAEETVYVGK